MPIVIQYFTQRIISADPPRAMTRYTGHCRCSGLSNVYGTTVQILLRTKYFTDLLARAAGPVFKLVLQFYQEMTNAKQWLDIDPLIDLGPSVFGDRQELIDCFFRLFRLLESAIPQPTSPVGIVFKIPHESPITQYFSGFHAGALSDRGITFFDTQSVVLHGIPETLGGFSLYLVVNRLSKTNSHLCFRDSYGWLSIRGRDIEAVSCFRRDNISLLGYIRDVNSTNVFRCPLKCESLKHRPLQLAEKRLRPQPDRSDDILPP
jgi:hypothetical protein